MLPHFRQLKKSKVAEPLDFTGVCHFLGLNKMLYGNATSKFF